MDRAISLEARRVDLSIELPFSLGRARVDPSAREITIGRKSERMQPQTLKVLVALHDKRGQVVTREELVDRCWDGRIVGEDVINRCILLLRRFADESRGFRIETVPRAGYRLIETATRTAPDRRRWLVTGSVAVLILIGLAGLLVRYETLHSPPRALTIALLPFTASSSDADSRKLAAAVHEAVANTLSQGAYAVSAIDTLPQGSRPPADFLISGELTGTTGKFVATVRMEETAHHVVVFSHQFEAKRDKVDDFPELVGAQVASQLSWSAPLLTIERRHPSDPTITTALLQASSAGLGGDALHDYEISRPLAAKDPNSPLAQTDLAFSTAFALDELSRGERGEAVAVARAAADRAVSLAPEFGDNYAPWCMLHSEQRMTECEDRLRSGMRADPDSPFANWFLVHQVLNPVGRNAEGLERAQASLAHDPYMPNKIGLVLRMLEANGRTKAAGELYQRSQRWWPNDDAIDWYRMTGIAERGDFETLKRFVDLVGGRKKPDAVLVAITGQSLPAVRAVCSTAKDFDATICMLALARMGDLDAAFIAADKLYPPRRGQTAADEDRIWLDHPDLTPLFFVTGPGAAPLRRDPRYVALAERVGLLAYWRTGRLPDFCQPPQREPICLRLRSNK
jgi:DNA-binding winged helix-turn-helix (wHTH) protein/TolB-like protein